MYMKESDVVLWICGDGDRSVGYVNDEPCSWYGPAELMPFSEYEKSGEGDVFECLDGTEYINRGGWMELDTYSSVETSLDHERKVAMIWQ